MSHKKINVLMAASEMAPFAKAGGLGDVIGSLPPSLNKLKCDTRVVLPKYGSIDLKKYGFKKIKSNIEIPSNEKIEKINIWEGNIPGTDVIVYLVDFEKYFGSKKIYLEDNSDSERFLFYSLAVLYIAKSLEFVPDIIHCHDYHAALIPDLLKVSNDKFFEKTKTIFTIHNFNYQGKSSPRVLSTGNLKKNSLDSLKKDTEDGDVNFDVQAILNSDFITTVSPTYAKEITTKEYGVGLERFIVKRKKSGKLAGIINGIDVDYFNPSTDKTIYKKYDSKSIDKKDENKEFLQKKLKLPVNKDIPIIGLVSRLVWQKGVDLITDDFSKLNCQFVFLGTGFKDYEKHLTDLAKKYPDKFSSNIMFDIKFANQIYAGSDMFLMPSRFEPCGLGQMIAMRYGSVPVVRATGGLVDTVPGLAKREEFLHSVSGVKAKGFAFNELSGDALYKELDRAIKIYTKKKRLWNKVRLNGMSEDFSWDNSAKKYLDLYRKVIG